jgi:hypothetical protein
VRTESPPQIEALGHLFKLAFWRLTLSTRNAVTWTYYWLDWFSLIIIITDFINSLLQRHQEKE